ncbi:MAG: CHAP domain-containing protein [Proteobacteria bacterium]|nr:CHAP domain-containing protein [Pseudomonadota bacterium]
MLTTRTILLTAAAVVGLPAINAEALTPLSTDLSIDPGITDGPSEHATLAPSAFERQPDAAYEPIARITNRRAHSQCVPFARNESGVDIHGDAYTWWDQAATRYERTNAPQEGAVLVLHGYNDPNRGHVAVVKEIVSSRMIIVDHANWLNHGEITRDVPVRDVSPNNDWSQVQVWYVPTRHWGARNYEVQGFILNMLQDAQRANVQAPAGAATTQVAMKAAS